MVEERISNTETSSTKDGAGQQQRRGKKCITKRVNRAKNNTHRDDYESITHCDCDSGTGSDGGCCCWACACD